MMAGRADEGEPVPYLAGTGRIHEHAQASRGEFCRPVGLRRDVCVRIQLAMSAVPRRLDLLIVRFGVNPLYLFRRGLPGLEDCGLALQLLIFQDGIYGAEAVWVLRVEVRSDVFQIGVISDQSCARHGCSLRVCCDGSCLFDTVFPVN